MSVEAHGGWPSVLGRLVDGEDLSRQEAAGVLADILAGDTTDAQIGAFVVALRAKGETVEEVSGMVDAMLAAAAPLELPAGVIDIVGTGGSARRRHGALNVSTMASIVAASAGALVCKHGNRRASSTSGSFDLLDVWGLPLDADPPAILASIERHGVGFCFARRFHPAMRHAGPARSQLRIPTVFNILGPLSHPGRVTRQVVGVGDHRLLDLVAGVLASRGSAHALVVHGREGLDEIGLADASEVREVRGGEISASVIEPAQFGFDADPHLPGGDPEANAEIARRVFDGEAGPGRAIVGMNAGAGLYVAGRAASLEEGVGEALAAIDDGRAAGTLAGLLAESRREGRAEHG